MATHIGLGFSREKDSFQASREAAIAAKLQIKQQAIDFVIVFASIHLDPREVLRGIQAVLGKVKITGCSAAGIILPGTVESRGVAILVISSTDIKFSSGLTKNIDQKFARTAGQELAKTALSEFGYQHRHIFIMFSDGLIQNSLQIIQGVQDILGKSFPFVGGASSDDFKFEKTYQYYNDGVYLNSAVGILLGGEISFGLGIKHGWKPLGKPRIATETDGNIIKKIDNQEAISIYESYFGEDAHQLRKIKLAKMALLYPLGVYIPGEEEYLLRNALDVRDDGALVCQGDVPQGSEIRLMIGTKESCLKAANDAAWDAKESLRDKEPKFAIIFDSFSRNKLLGRDNYKEIEIIQTVLGKNIPIIGFYTYGEEAPLKALDYRGQTYFHNETVAILTVAN